MTDRDRIARPLVWAVAVMIVIAALVGGTSFLLRSCTNETKRIAENLRDAVRETLNFAPVINRDQVTVFGPPKETLEVIVLKDEFSHETRWEHTWWRSTKALRLKGYFVASYGMNLGNNFAFTINSADRTVDVTSPEVGLLSLEMLKYEALQDEDGWWNNLSKEDREQAVNDLLKGAKQLAETNKDLLQQAQRIFADRLVQLIESSGGRAGKLNGVPLIPEVPKGL